MVNFDKLSAEVEMFQENIKRTRRTIKDEDEERRGEGAEGGGVDLVSRISLCIGRLRDVEAFY